MRFRTHLWTSTVTALVCYPRSPHRAFLLAIAGIAIDLDHLVLYGLHTGDWSISGALHYDQYRAKPIVPGDTRPRYGSLRSWLHYPVVTLPLLWLISRSHKLFRPITLGLTLHLALDNALFPIYWRVAHRARRRCERCGCGGKALHVRYKHGSPTQHWRDTANYLALCRDCYTISDQ